MNRTSNAHIHRYWSRAVLVFATLIYIGMFNWIYQDQIAPIYSYFGLGYSPVENSYLVMSWVACILPALWMPIQFRRPSLLLFYVQYYIMFIPTSFIVHYSSNPAISSVEALNLVILMLIGLTLIQSFYLIPLLKVSFKKISSPKFWTVVIIFMAILFIYTAVLLGANFRLTNFEEIYDVRFSTADIVEASGNRFGFYAQTWLAGFFLPFIFALGAFSKRRLLIPIVVVGYVFLFGIGGSKTTLLAVAYMFLIYLLLTKVRSHTGAFFALGNSLLLLISWCLERTISGDVSLWYRAIIPFRVFCAPPLILVQYYEFFKSHPLTYMSHVNGINFFLQYPYDLDLGRTIGYYFYSNPIGLNAGLWAGDGIAGFGTLGIVIVSLLCGIVFWILDSISRPYDPRFVAVSISFIATSFANTSLSTTLMTGGLGLLMSALMVLPNKGIAHIIFRLKGNYRNKKQNVQEGRWAKIPL